jgi:hypothetical protein
MNRFFPSSVAVTAAVTLLASAALSAQASTTSAKPSFVQPGLYQAAPVNTLLGLDVADFNADGHEDVASAGVFSADRSTTMPRALPVQLGDGKGHLRGTTLTVMPSKTKLEGPIAIDVGDVDADGKPDIVAATLDLDFSGPQTVITYRMRVLVGKGDGSFNVLKGFELPAESEHVVVADLTGDGRLDLAYATNAPQGDDVWTATGRGDGTFAQPVAVTQTQQLSISTLEAVDLDDDQDLDLVYGQGCVVARMNSGGGAFGAPICNPLIDYPQTVAVADLTGDGTPDLALGDASGGHVRVAAGDGTGHFTSLHVYGQVSSQVLSVVATDVEGDGDLDLVASGDAAPSFQTSIAVLRSAGDGSFRLVSRWVTGGANVTVGDFTEDGLPDLVSEDSALHRAAMVTVNAGDGHFRAPQLTVAAAKRLDGQLASDVFAGDFDHNGRSDVMLVASSAVIVYLNQGGGSFVKWSSPKVSFGSGTILSAALGDLNGDGDLDVALGGFSEANVTILLGRGDGTFTSPATYNNGSGAAAMSIGIGDVTGDHVPDVLTNTFTSLSVLPGKSDGTLAAPRLSGSAQANQTVLKLSDLDGDGDLDAVGAAKTGTPDNAFTEVTTALNDGAGTFGDARSTTIATNLNDGVVAEFTGDGRSDLAISGAKGSHSGISGVFVMPGTSSGLGVPMVVETSDIPGGLDAGDYNGDGFVDLAATTSTDVAVWSNPGDGRFTSPPTATILTPFDSAALVSSRFTKDGRPDIVTFLGSNPPEFALDVNNTK